MEASGFGRGTHNPGLVDLNCLFYLLENPLLALLTDTWPVTLRPSNSERDTYMDINRFKDQLAAGTMTRRDFKKALAAVGVGMATVPMTRRAARAEGQPMYFGWAGYEDPAFMTTYIEKHGEAPEYTY